MQQLRPLLLNPGLPNGPDVLYHTYRTAEMARSWQHGVFLPRWADWNQNSRFDLVVALVEDHTFQIDKYVANTGDYALYDGHYYSDKAPGMALLGLPVYSAFRYFVAPTLMPPLENTTRATDALDATLDPNGTGINPEKLRFFVGMAFTDLIVAGLPVAAALPN